MFTCLLSITGSAAGFSLQVCWHPLLVLVDPAFGASLFCQSSPTSPADHVDILLGVNVGAGVERLHKVLYALEVESAPQAVAQVERSGGMFFSVHRAGVETRRLGCALGFGCRVGVRVPHHVENKTRRQEGLVRLELQNQLLVEDFQPILPPLRLLLLLLHRESPPRLGSGRRVQSERHHHALLPGAVRCADAQSGNHGHANV